MMPDMWGPPSAAEVSATESENAKLRKRVKELEAQNAELLKTFEQLQAERDAAVKDIRKWCCTCKHCGKEVREAPCNSCRRNGQGGTEERWEWRGVQKEE